MKKLGKTEKSNNYRIRFNFLFLEGLGGGGCKVLEVKIRLFSMSGTATLLSKYGTADDNHVFVAMVTMPRMYCT